jgi:hypothetical protein
MLYANRIENETYLSTDSLERIIIDKSCIESVATTLNPDFPIVLYVKLNKTGYRIELKPNKNFYTIAGFFEYIRDYSEIDFETNEVLVEKQKTDKEYYDELIINLEEANKKLDELKKMIDTTGLYKEKDNED